MMALSDSVSTTLKFSIVAEDKDRLWVKQTSRTCCSNKSCSYSGRLTFPVHPNSRIPEVVADFMSGHSFHSMCRFEGIQYNPVLLHLAPINLSQKKDKEVKKENILGSQQRMKTEQSSPSSPLPRSPAASWHRRPRPEGSRSCDSAPSPPPDTSPIILINISEQTRLTFANTKEQGKRNGTK